MKTRLFQNPKALSTPFFVILFIMTSPSFATQVETQNKNNNFQVEWNLRTDLSYLEKIKDESSASGFGTHIKLKQNLTDKMFLKAQFGLGLNSARSQSRFGDISPRNGLNLNQAVVELKPLEVLSLQAGAINQGQASHFLPMSSASRAFPGLLQSVESNNESVNFQLTTQQVIPSSSSSNNQRTEKEKTPYLFTEQLGISLQIYSKLSLRGEIGYFEYQNLPTTVANNSALNGNSVYDAGNANAQFIYPFKGYILGGGIKYEISPSYEINANLLKIRNDAAPTAYNQGLFSRLSLVSYTESFKIEPSLLYYYFETDVLPSEYLNSYFGGTNTVGRGISLKWSFIKNHFSLKSDYVQTEIINTNLEQSPQTLITIGIETDYGIL